MRKKQKVMGRPRIFTQKLGDKICSRIAKGQSLREICRDDEMPDRTTIYDWILSGKYEDFSNQYKKACDLRADELAEECFEIADDGTNDWIERNIKGQDVTVADIEHIARSKLRLDTRKWYLSKVMPKKYGDKLDLNVGGQTDNPILTKDISGLSNEEIISLLSEPDK